MWYIDDMKFPYLPVGILFSFLALSCTHQAPEYTAIQDTDSVRYEVRKVRDAVTWTTPLEPSALSKEPAGQMKGVYFYPGAGFSGMSLQSSVFPSLENFGSLDTSKVSRKILTGINDFLKQLAHKTLTFSSALFDKPYEGVVILYEASFLPHIQSWTIGKPYTDKAASSSFEVPVLLTTEEGTCSIRIFLNPEKAAEDEVVIQQVMFGAVKSE